MTDKHLWQNYYNVASIDEALEILAGGSARIVAGGTDLILELERGVRTGVKNLIDITRIRDLDQILLDENDVVHLGPMVTHNQCAASKLLAERAFLLAQACWGVGAAQIRNRGTVAGNLITGSPANDTIAPLMALEARLVLRSARGERTVPITQFYQGVRRTDLQPDEMLVDIYFPAIPLEGRSTFMKIGLRRAQAISVVNAAVRLILDGGGAVADAKITLGAVAPVIIHAGEAEESLTGQHLTAENIKKAALLAAKAARPIDDVRGTASFRREMVRVAVMRSLQKIAAGAEREGFPTQPILLQTPVRRANPPVLTKMYQHTDDASAIETVINGKVYSFQNAQHKTLLQLLREDAGLIGTKEGCAEGECGACTVILDGQAVMSCLAPAGRAHGAEITTIEGLAQEGHLHPVQQAFIDMGAVQCGYCTPGFVMSAAILLQEQPHPNRTQIEQAITGNLCRCTGYYKIVEAIERASY